MNIKEITEALSRSNLKSDVKQQLIKNMELLEKIRDNSKEDGVIYTVNEKQKKKGFFVGITDIWGTAEYLGDIYE